LSSWPCPGRKPSQAKPSVDDDDDDDGDNNDVIPTQFPYATDDGFWLN